MHTQGGFRVRGSRIALKEEASDELWLFDPVAEEWGQILPGSTNS
jgi:hypothetical protein